MWSVGVILYVVLSGTPPFSDDALFSQIQNAEYTMDGDEWRGISAAAKNLVARLLTKSPKDRLNASQVSTVQYGSGLRTCNSSLYTFS